MSLGKFKGLRPRPFTWGARKRRPHREWVTLLAIEGIKDACIFTWTYCESHGETGPGAILIRTLPPKSPWRVDGPNKDNVGEMAPDSQGSNLESVGISWRCKLPDRDKLDPVLETVITGSQVRRFLWNPSKYQRTPTLTLAVTLDCAVSPDIRWLGAHPKESGALGWEAEGGRGWRRGNVTFPYIHSPTTGFPAPSGQSREGKKL